MARSKKSLNVRLPLGSGLSLHSLVTNSAMDLVSTQESYYVSTKKYPLWKNQLYWRVHWHAFFPVLKWDNTASSLNLYLQLKDWDEQLRNPLRSLHYWDGKNAQGTGGENAIKC